MLPSTTLENIKSIYRGRRKILWYPTRDLNPHLIGPKPIPSSNWGNRAYGTANWVRTNTQSFKDSRATITLWRYINKGSYWICTSLRHLSIGTTFILIGCTRGLLLPLSKVTRNYYCERYFFPHSLIILYHKF